MICSVRARKYELSAQGTILRRTTIAANSERREVLYDKVDGIDTINDIEFISERWEPYGIESRCYFPYIIMEQLTAAGKYTGNIKIIKRSRALYNFFGNSVDAMREADWKYYKRRKQPMK